MSARDPEQRRQYLLGVIDKLDEAAFFLKTHIRAGYEAYGHDYYVGAFSQACDSAWDCLAGGCASPPALKAWFKRAEKELSLDDRREYFRRARNSDVHKGISHIDGVSIRLYLRDGRVERETTPHLRGRKGFDVATECESYLRTLSTKAAEGFAQLDDEVDPKGEYRKQGKRLATLCGPP